MTALDLRKEMLSGRVSGLEKCLCAEDSEISWVWFCSVAAVGAGKELLEAQTLEASPWNPGLVCGVKRTSEGLPVQPLC